MYDSVRVCVHIVVILPVLCAVPLNEAHDIGERLEVLIETLPGTQTHGSRWRCLAEPDDESSNCFMMVADIERCHVHLDWETEHKAEHQGKDGGLFSLLDRADVSPRAAAALDARTLGGHDMGSSGSREGRAEEEGQPTTTEASTTQP